MTSHNWGRKILITALGLLAISLWFAFFVVGGKHRIIVNDFQLTSSQIAFRVKIEYAYPASYKVIARDESGRILDVFSEGGTEREIRLMDRFHYNGYSNTGIAVDLKDYEEVEVILKKGDTKHVNPGSELVFFRVHQAGGESGEFIDYGVQLSR